MANLKALGTEQRTTELAYSTQGAGGRLETMDVCFLHIQPESLACKSIKKSIGTAL